MKENEKKDNYVGFFKARCALDTPEYIELVPLEGFEGVNFLINFDSSEFFPDLFDIVRLLVLRKYDSEYNNRCAFKEKNTLKRLDISST